MIQLSIILATRDEKNNIGRCLESLLNQQVKYGVEIIVIDNSTSSETRDIAKKFTNHVYSFQKINPNVSHMNPRGAQLNIGVSKAMGHIIFFPDADMTFEDGLLNEIVEKCCKYDALYVPEIIVGRGVLGKVRNFERSFYNMTTLDAIRVVKKSIYIKVEGFDQDNIEFGPDDWDFTKRVRALGAEVGLAQYALYHHEESLGLVNYLKKKYLYSNNFDSYIDKWGESDADIKKQFGIHYRYFGVFLEKGKWRKIFKCPFLFLGTFLLKIAVGIGYIYSKVGKFYKLVYEKFDK